MKRWQGAALGVALCSGCLEPLVGDDPGYSQNVLPPGSVVPSGYADLQISHKIDRGDGLSVPLVPMSTGYADGRELKYWDFGPAGRSAGEAYALATCGADGQPLPDARIGQWPVIVDNIPGDGDYTPYRAISWVCLTAQWGGQIVSSVDALGDAIKLGLLAEPLPPTFWVNLPIVSAPVEVEGPAGIRASSPAYYRGVEVRMHSFEDQEGRFPYDGKPLMAGKAYDIVKAGQTAPVRVIFSQHHEKEGARNPAYSPYWNLNTVTLKPLMGATPEELAAAAAAEDMMIQSWTKESDLTAAAKRGAVVITPSMTNPRVNRPFVIQQVTP